MSRYREWSLDCKVYVGNLGSGAAKHEIESAFGKYGPLRNVWVARNPPGFAFVEFEDPRDAEDAVRALDGTRLCGTRVRVEMSHGRSRRGGRRGPPPPPRVYHVFIICSPEATSIGRFQNILNLLLHYHLLLPTTTTTTTTTACCPLQPFKAVFPRGSANSASYKLRINGCQPISDMSQMSENKSSHHNHQPNHQFETHLSLQINPNQ